VCGAQGANSKAEQMDVGASSVVQCTIAAGLEMLSLVGDDTP
jgi:hypothetical protein